MATLIPNVGQTTCSRAISLLKHHTDQIVGTFWVISGSIVKADLNIPDWWSDTVLKENQAQAILNTYLSTVEAGERYESVYDVFCIIVVADKGNPANLSYVVQQVRMVRSEGLDLLEILAEHNIPAHTEAADPYAFLSIRYGQPKTEVPHLLYLQRWNTQVWEDYCNYLIAGYGRKMLSDYWERVH